jgi:hypothetical protein
MSNIIGKIVVVLIMNIVILATIATRNGDNSLLFILGGINLLAFINLFHWKKNKKYNMEVSNES